ncbi:drug/metabolite transporter (DMT)-like permease [Friedmanniella endophytica]|uniref:Drug/metabolite transporter (DMT)-like permease n=1 Tax=Microlunatus kandeliicorticis TaxID=1759536 RepID=A0A7W3IPB2_9ACTN|nr:DMT family transporter [Microlunatus kandeliicorticis]MBA8792746.1 drug/metabolite transporter (DMT)-like permease [Microlunatus kandeliicorticis]
MPALAIVLVLAGACTHAIWNLAAKGGAHGGPVFVWLTAVVSVLALTPFAVVLLARDPVSPAVFVLAGVVSGLCHATYFTVLQAGYRAGDVSIVYPLARGSGPLLTVVVAVVGLGERPGWLGLVGAAVLIGGVLVISLAGSRGASVSPAAVGFGLGTGVAIAAYTLWDSHAVAPTRAVGSGAVGGLGLDPVVQMWGSCLALTLVLTPFALRQARRSSADRVPAIWTTHRRAVLLVGVGSPLAYVLILYATRLAPVALVAPGREVSVVLVALAGWLWLREPNPRPRLVGAAVVLVGIVLLALA